MKGNQFRNVFSDERVTLLRVYSHFDTQMVEYRRTTPMPGYYGTPQLVFSKPMDVFLKTYSHIPDDNNGKCPSPTPASSPALTLQEAI